MRYKKNESFFTESETGTLSIRFHPKERDLIELACFVLNENCTQFIKRVTKEWLNNNEKMLIEKIEINKRLRSLVEENKEIKKNGG